MGAFIKPHRCYVAHRTKRNFYTALREIEEILSVEKVERKDLEQVRAKLNSYLGIMKHYRTYNIKRTLLTKSYKLFKYGYLYTHLHKYSIKRKCLELTRQGSCQVLRDFFNQGIRVDDLGALHRLLREL